MVHTVPERSCPDEGDRGPLPLAGFRIAVTSDRRSADLVSALERLGASVLHAPALPIAPIEHDDELTSDTRAVIAARPDRVVITTAYGMRRWMEATDAVGLGDELMHVLQESQIIVRGPKGRGAVRAAGLDDDGIAVDERTSTCIDMLLESGVHGLTVAVQLHGYADVEQLQRLEAGGARVVTVAPYRWRSPHDSERLQRLIEAVCARGVDLVTFTSAPAVDALVGTAGELGCADDLVDALRGDVAAAAVGPVTAVPLQELGIEPIVPERLHLGALIRVVSEHLSSERVMRVDTALGPVQVRGRSVVLGEESAILPPGPLAIFRALAAAGGAVRSRDELIATMPAVDGAGAEHALDVAMSRLRQSLPDAGLVSTVIKRGYRLTV